MKDDDKTTAATCETDARFPFGSLIDDDPREMIEVRWDMERTIWSVAPVSKIHGMVIWLEVRQREVPERLVFVFELRDPWAACYLNLEKKGAACNGLV